MNNIVLSCQGVAKTYLDGAAKIEVLRDMNIDVNAGEMIAIVGNSGSGKSSFLHLLAGLDKPTAGRVTIAGKNIHQLSEKAKCDLRNRHLGFIYQFHHLLPEFSALENVAMPLIIQGGESDVIIERATQLLDQVGLKMRLQHRLGQLSGGERQRVAIARALVAKPLCVLADEPTGNLDPRNAEKVLQLFFDLQREQKTSVIMVTHDPMIAARAQRVLRIEEGQLIDITQTPVETKTI